MLNDPACHMTALLDMIDREQTLARLHDTATATGGDHADAAQAADERAEAARRTARALVEAAFPGVSWNMLRQALL